MTHTQSPLPTSITALEREARAQVEAVADDTAARLELRKDFYRHFGRGDELVPLGYGESEVKFMEWEIARGALAPIGPDGRGGSRWWRDVNSEFLYFGQLGRLAHERGVPADQLPAPARLWLKFISDPNERSWYRAHNASICSGYVQHSNYACAESRNERVFLNMVLYRLLYAQGLVEGVELGFLGKLLANPRLPSVDAMVHLPDFYPKTYPLTEEEFRVLVREAHGPEELAVMILDDVLISPHLMQLYKLATEWTGVRELLNFIKDGEPIYPNLDPHLFRTYFWSRVARVITYVLGWFKGKR